MSISTPNYVLTEDLTLYTTSQKSTVLPVGSFVRPIELCYVPKHVLDSTMGRTFSKLTQVFCYTYFGIVPINWNLIRKV